MDFLKNNKALIIQIAVGAIMAVVMQILHLPVWFIGAVIAGTITIATRQATNLYESKVEPRIKETMDKRSAGAENEASVVVKPDNEVKPDAAETKPTKPKVPRKPKSTASKAAPKRKPKSQA